MLNETQEQLFSLRPLKTSNDSKIANFVHRREIVWNEFLRTNIKRFLKLGKMWLVGGIL